MKNGFQDDSAERTERVEDAAGLAQVEAECFSHPLDEARILSLLRDPTVRFFAVRFDGEIVGSLWLQTVLDEGYIGNVAVRPAWRRRGIADCLLASAGRFAREQNLAFLTLEVRASNDPAIALYEKHGYSRVGRRPGYYSEPKEDAILMTNYLNQETL